MALQSRLFRGDTRLNACLIDDPSHVTPGARGDHVAKIQTALNTIEDAGLNVDGVYGQVTATAVKTYKNHPSRRILQPWQTTADDIVGKRTIAFLDREMLGKEPLSGPTRIIPLFPIQRLPVLSAARHSGAPLVAFKIGADLGFQGRPQINPSSFMTLPVGGIGRFVVINGVDETVGSNNNAIALVFDPTAGPLAHGGTMRISKKEQQFSVIAGAPGTALISTTDKSRSAFRNLFNMLSVNVQAQLPAREVTIAFHFLGGPAAVATKRDKNSIASAVATMNSIYGNQAKITFRIVGTGGSPIVVPEFANRTQALFFSVLKRTPDWNAVIKNRSAAAHFNVFFAAKIQVLTSDPFGTAIALTDVPGKPGFRSRDCVMQDDLKGIELGLVLAHEAGHALGEDGNAVAGHLMNDAAPGRTIPADTAGRMNDQAGKL